MESFEIASRDKYRYEGRWGILGVEDLWDLPLVNKKANATVPSLNEVAVCVHETLTKNTAPSFVEQNDIDQQVKVYENKLEIVKRVIAVKQKEAKDALDRKKASHNKRVIGDIIARKKNDVLEGKDLAELESMYNSL